MSKIKGTVVFAGAAAEPKGYETDADVEFNSNEGGVLQSLRVGKKNYTIPQSNDMFLTVYTTTVMNTSTLPSIQVPKLTADQIANVQTAMSQGKDVTIDASYNGVTNQFKVLESDHDGDVGGIRLVYYNYYLDYTNDDDSVVVTYAQIGGGGGGAKIYKHELTWNNDEGYPLNTVCGYFRRSAQYTSMEGFSEDAICITGYTRSGQPKNSGSWSYAATESLKFYEGSAILFSVNIDASAPDSYTVTEL